MILIYYYKCQGGRGSLDPKSTPFVAPLRRGNYPAYYIYIPIFKRHIVECFKNNFFVLLIRVLIIYYLRETKNVRLDIFRRKTVRSHFILTLDRISLPPSKLMCL